VQWLLQHRSSVLQIELSLRHAAEFDVQVPATLHEKVQQSASVAHPAPTSLHATPPAGEQKPFDAQTPLQQAAPSMQARFTSRQPSEGAAHRPSGPEVPLQHWTFDVG
jgi:hypothetical protein